MAYAKTIRDLSQVNGTGTMSISGSAGKPALISFSATQFFYRGETVRAVATGQSYTVAFGADTKWYSMQPFIEGVTNVAFRRTAQDVSTWRGGAVGLGMYWCPNARYYLYRDWFDHNVNPDGYYFWDTTVPINKMHPYSRTKWSGQSWMGKNEATQIISISSGPTPDLANRVASLDSLDPVVY